MPNPAGGSHSFGYEAEGWLRCIDGCQNGSYLNDALGQRAYESRPWYATWPVYLNGQVMTEYTDAGNVTDYIYANGKKIARVSSQKPIFTMHGVRDASIYMGCGAEGPVSGAGGAGYIIQNGDRLLMSFKQTQPSYGGIVFWLTNGGAAVATDAATGEGFYSIDFNDGQWHAMSGDLSSFAGQTIGYVQTGFHNQMPAGTFDIYFADVVIQSASGATIPILTGQAATLNPYSTCGEHNQIAQTMQVTAGSPVSTNYYLADQVGTTQMELSGGGWPVWRGNFTPFGQEVGIPYALGPQSSHGTAMHFKFTGKERDAESGLDYFGARYYGSNMGRFMSPDWSAKEEPVPYAKLDNPQSLNLYSYVQNNPLSRFDIDGHQECNSNPGLCTTEMSAKANGSDNTDAQHAGAEAQNAREAKAQQQNNTQTSDNTLEAQNNTPPPPGRTPAQGGTPGSTVEIPDGKGGKTVRKFGPDGKAETDVDHGHDHGAGDPHAHDWDWGKKPPRQPGRALTPEEQKNVKRAAGGVTAGVIIYWIISEGSRLFPPRNLIPIP